MKVFVLTFICIIGIVCSSKAQVGDPRLNSAIPTFSILKSNGGYFTNSDVKKNVPLVLIYFAPDCDHCIKMLDNLFKKIHQLDKASIVLVTFKPVTDLPWFEKKYQLGQFHNITVGTEGISYVLRNYYRLDKTPFIAVYNKMGKLAFYYKNEPPVDELLTRFKKM